MAPKFQDSSVPAKFTCLFITPLVHLSLPPSVESAKKLSHNFCSLFLFVYACIKLYLVTKILGILLQHLDIIIKSIFNRHASWKIEKIKKGRDQRFILCKL